MIMSDEILTPDTGPKGSFWKRLGRFMHSLEEAVGRTEMDDLGDRIAALENRVDALSSSHLTPERGAANPVSDS